MRMWAIVAAAVLAGAGAARGQELRADMYLITPGAADQPIGQVLITSSSAGTKFVADLPWPAARPARLPRARERRLRPRPGRRRDDGPRHGGGRTLRPRADRRASRSRGQRPSGRPALPDRPAGRPGVGEALAPTDQGRLAAQGPGLVLHAGGDNYSDTPAAGGGGDRIACGIIQVADASSAPAARPGRPRRRLASARSRSRSG